LVSIAELLGFMTNLHSPAAHPEGNAAQALVWPTQNFTVCLFAHCALFLSVFTLLFRHSLQIHVLFMAFQQQLFFKILSARGDLTRVRPFGIRSVSSVVLDRKPAPHAGKNTHWLVQK